MPRHEVVYDKDLKETPEFQQLYNKWNWIRKHNQLDQFEKFMDFYNWSIENGFELNAKLKRLDNSKPYIPENCVWIAPKLKPTTNAEEEKEWIALWNKTVNRIRVHYGMKPF